MYKNDDLNIIDNQIPHWFGPFIFIISFLIPNLMCIILNSDNIYNKIMNEINDEHFFIFSKESYLHYCVIEHIRLFNTININMQRTVKKNMSIEDVKFTKGDQIFILFSSILRDENAFKNNIEYNSIPDWDSIGHMAMIAELEEVFGKSMDIDDIIEFSSYNKGIEILKKYEVSIF